MGHKEVCSPDRGLSRVDMEVGRELCPWCSQRVRGHMLVYSMKTSATSSVGDDYWQKPHFIDQNGPQSDPSDALYHTLKVEETVRCFSLGFVKSFSSVLEAIIRFCPEV